MDASLLPRHRMCARDKMMGLSPLKDILPRTVWFLDFDGSLCPHQEVWEERVYDPDEILREVEALASIARGILWNTGRRPPSLGGVHPRFLDHSGYFVQGSVKWDAKAGQAKTIAPLLDPDVGARFAAEIGGDRSLRLEVKETGLRVASVQGGQAAKIKGFIEKHAALLPKGWSWRVGHRGAEALPDGYDKGSALREEWGRWPTDSIPVAVGDDVFDRPAFEEALARGGYVVAVGDSCGWVTQLAHRPSQIIYCETPARVAALWLSR